MMVKINGTDLTGAVGRDLFAAMVVHNGYEFASAVVEWCTKDAGHMASCSSPGLGCYTVSLIKGKDISSKSVSLYRYGWMLSVGHLKSHIRLSNHKAFEYWTQPFWIHWNPAT